jgi:hypothetical protein
MQVGYFPVDYEANRLTIRLPVIEISQYNNSQSFEGDSGAKSQSVVYIKHSSDSGWIPTYA